MQCPLCGTAELKRETRALPYVYKGEKTTIAGVLGDYCLACDEAMLDASESARVSTAMQVFNRQINAG